jgi:hypothetical protein
MAGNLAWVERKEKIIRVFKGIGLGFMEQTD